MSTAYPIHPSFIPTTVNNHGNSKEPIMKLTSSELTSIRALIAGYRQSAAYLTRSADELDELLRNSEVYSDDSVKAIPVTGGVADTVLHTPQFQTADSIGELSMPNHKKDKLDIAVGSKRGNITTDSEKSSTDNNLDEDVVMSKRKRTAVPHQHLMSSSSSTTIADKSVSSASDTPKSRAEEDNTTNMNSNSESIKVKKITNNSNTTGHNTINIQQSKTMLNSTTSLITSLPLQATKTINAGELRVLAPLSSLMATGPSLVTAPNAGGTISGAAVREIVVIPAGSIPSANISGIAVLNSEAARKAAIAAATNISSGHNHNLLGSGIPPLVSNNDSQNNKVSTADTTTSTSATATNPNPQQVNYGFCFVFLYLVYTQKAALVLSLIVLLVKSKKVTIENDFRITSRIKKSLWKLLRCYAEFEIEKFPRIQAVVFK